MSHLPESAEWLAGQKRAIHRHRGLAHPFLMHLESRIGSIGDLRAFVREIYFMVQNFPFHIAGSIAHCRDEQFFLVMADNLYVETGAGSGKHHIELYRDLLRALDLGTGRLREDEVWESTRKLERTCGRLYASWNMAEKLGGLYAFETMSATMVSYWEEALRTTGTIDGQAFRFFTLHKDIEIRHSNDLEPIIRDYATSAIFRKRFERSALEVMTSLEAWWDDMLDFRSSASAGSTRAASLRAPG